MQRRDFVKGAAIAATSAAAAASLPAPAISQNRRQLRMVTSWPKGFPGLDGAATRLAARLALATDGRFTVKVFPGGEIVKPFAVHDAVQQGTADLYHSADYYFSAKSKAYNFFTAVPGGFTADEMNAWLLHGGGQALWDEVGGQFGIKHLPCSNTGLQMGGWFRKPIAKAADFKGLRIRIPGLGGEVLKALGAKPVTLPGAEILPNLKSGAIDAVEWFGPWNDLAFGLQKATKIAMYPGIHEPGSMLSVGLSRKLWDGLSASDKAIFANACHAEHVFGQAEFLANNARALQTLIGTHQVKYTPFPRPVFKKMAEAAQDVVSTVGKADALTKKVHDSFVKFRKDATAWWRISDGIYQTYRELPES